MKVLRCFRCSWLNPLNHERNYCYGCGSPLNKVMVVNDEKLLSEVKHQPSWYMREKGKSDEQTMQDKLDDWKLEMFL